ncbi:hypothetical protein GCM10017752_67360 [Streptomyces roseoviridis]
MPRDVPSEFGSPGAEGRAGSEQAVAAQQVGAALAGQSGDLLEVADLGESGTLVGHRHTFRRGMNRTGSVLVQVPAPLRPVERGAPTQCTKLGACISSGNGTHKPFGKALPQNCACAPPALVRKWPERSFIVPRVRGMSDAVFGVRGCFETRAADCSGTVSSPLLRIDVQ